MFLIIGLGNPGKEYENTRHNAGFMALDAIASNFQSKFNAQISKGLIGNKEVILVKPQTFMNESGATVKKLIRNLKLEIRNLVVIHDDIDLLFGTIKISQNSGSAGHKGVESIIKQLGTKNFIRVRIGIRPQQGKPQNAENFVLQKFSKQETKTLSDAIKNSCSALETILKEGVQSAMNSFNK